MGKLLKPQHQPLTERIRTGKAPALFNGTPHTAKTFWEFFTVTIRNKHTRLAYLKACYRFADWTRALDVDLFDVEPMMVSAYIEQMQDTHSSATIKQHLAAIRRLFDFLVVNQVLAQNPAHAVKGPSHKVHEGKTPILTAEEMRHLLDSIPLNNIAGYRDRAMIAVMGYTFARVGAVCSLRTKDYYTQSHRSYFILDEKGGVQNKVPAHHTVQAYMGDYLAAQAEYPDLNLPLFRPMRKDRKTLALHGMTSRIVLYMVKRRCLTAGLPNAICNHSFRGTGITNYMQNGGTLEMAAKIAGHASTTTTQLYDRRDADIILDEIERVRY